MSDREPEAAIAKAQSGSGGPAKMARCLVVIDTGRTTAEDRTNFLRFWCRHGRRVPGTHENVGNHCTACRNLFCTTSLAKWGVLGQVNFLGGQAGNLVLRRKPKMGQRFRDAGALRPSPPVTPGVWRSRPFYLYKPCCGARTCVKKRTSPRGWEFGEVRRRKDLRQLATQVIVLYQFVALAKTREISFDRQPKSWLREFRSLDTYSRNCSWHDSSVSARFSHTCDAVLNHGGDHALSLLADDGGGTALGGAEFRA